MLLGRAALGEVGLLPFGDELLRRHGAPGPVVGGCPAFVQVGTIVTGGIFGCYVRGRLRRLRSQAPDCGGRSLSQFACVWRAATRRYRGLRGQIHSVREDSSMRGTAIRQAILLTVFAHLAWGPVAL